MNALDGLLVAASPAVFTTREATTTAATTTTASLTTIKGPIRATHVVTVGKADHAFRPDTVLAEIGDTIEFQFFPVNHSVVRAE